MLSCAALASCRAPVCAAQPRRNTISASGRPSFAALPRCGALAGLWAVAAARRRRRGDGARIRPHTSGTLFIHTAAHCCTSTTYSRPMSNSGGGPARRRAATASQIVAQAAADVQVGCTEGGVRRAGAVPCTPPLNHTPLAPPRRVPWLTSLRQPTKGGFAQWLWPAWLPPPLAARQSCLPLALPLCTCSPTLLKWER